VAPSRSVTDRAPYCYELVLVAHSTQNKLTRGNGRSYIYSIHHGCLSRARMLPEHNIKSIDADTRRCLHCMIHVKHNTHAQAKIRRSRRRRGKGKGVLFQSEQQCTCRSSSAPAAPTTRGTFGCPEAPAVSLSRSCDLVPATFLPDRVVQGALFGLPARFPVPVPTMIPVLQLFRRNLLSRWIQASSFARTIRAHDRDLFFCFLEHKQILYTMLLNPCCRRVTLRVTEQLAKG
jgi:hypothetical protein